MNPVKKILLSGKNGKGKYVLVDSYNYTYLNQFTWQYGAGGYAARHVYLGKGKQKNIFMHHLIIDIPTGKETDHINGNRLDNRKENLRAVTRSQNCMNRKISNLNNTSGYKGVVWHKVGKGYWKAYIKSNGKHIHLGLFEKKEDAAKAYDEAATLYFGEYAKLNFEGGILN